MNASRSTTAPPDRHVAIHELITGIYDAALEPSSWQDFVDALSSCYGGAPVGLWIQLPGLDSPPEHYHSGFGAVDEEHFARLIAEGLPWGSDISEGSNEGFTQLQSIISAEDLTESKFYNEWMKPRGIAPVCPLIHTFGIHMGRAVAGVGIHQLERLPRFDDADVEFANQLVPHLHMSFRIHDRLRGLQRRRDVLSEVIDQLPIGILLVDDEGQMLAANRSALHSVQPDHGLEMRDGRLHAQDPVENRWLHSLLAKAVAPESRGTLDPASAMGITPPDGETPLPVLISPLSAPEFEVEGPEAAAVVFLGDTQLARVTGVNMLRNIYGLTGAEAELARLLAEGLSLEEASLRREVKLTTARSQLKQVFAKTGAKRQGDLVRIVLSGIPPLQDEGGADPKT
jgi:DNA-binding CsgD family transcriptional regulator